MIDPTKLDKLNSLASPLPGQHPAVQTSFTDLVGQMKATAGNNSFESDILEGWTSYLMNQGQDQSSATPAQPSQPGHKKLTEELTAYLQNPVNTANPIMNTAPPGLDGTTGADNSNTGSINSGLMI